MPGRQFVADDPIVANGCAIDPNMDVQDSATVRVHAINRRFGFNQILIEGAAELFYALGPKITSIYFYDNSLSGAAQWNDLVNRSDGEKALIDRNTCSTTAVVLAGNT